MVRVFKYIIKSAKEDDVKRCVASLLDIEEAQKVKGISVSYQKTENVHLAEIEFDLYEWTLMDLPNLWDSRENMLDACKDVAKQLPDCSFKIKFKAHWESANYFQKGECMFTGKWIEYSDFGYTEEPPTYLKYSAVFVNGQFCDEEIELLDEDGCLVE